MRKIKYHFVAVIVAIIILVATAITIIFSSNWNVKAEETGKYITIEDFIKYIVKEMGWSTDPASEQPYIDAAMEKGILKEGDFKDYSEYLTRTDAAVIANRLDELIHLKYGYPEDVYEFLKDCRFYKGKLCYDTDGKFYPEGATRETYPEEIFNDEVVTPILGKVSKNEKGFRTFYKYIRDEDGNIVKRYMEIGRFREDSILNADPFNENSEILKAWKTIKEGERKLKSVLEKRISDIKDIPKSKREAIAAIVAKGIMKGYSNGMYVQNREFRGNNRITASGAKSVIEKVLDPDKRAPISPDGQLIRTTNLPKNADEFPYILECFPNEFYEMKYTFMYLSDYISGEIGEDEYAYPKEVDLGFLYDKYYQYKVNVESDCYDIYDFTLSQVEKYLNHIFNVDYRTVDEEWKDGLAYTHPKYKKDWRIESWIDEYVEFIKKNKVIVESKRIAVEPGTLYECRGSLYIRAYVKYRVSAKNINEPSDELIYNSWFDIKGDGKWRYCYFDIMLSSNNGRWGVPPVFGISDYFFNESFKQGG